MAKKPATKDSTAAPAAATEADEGGPRHAVKVSRVVDVGGFRYKPGVDHTVDDDTLAELKALKAVLS